MSAVRIKVAGPVAAHPRELLDEASRIIQACYAEVGFTPGNRWDDRRGWVNTIPVPEDVQHRAAKIACDALGIPYEVLDEDGL